MHPTDSFDRILHLLAAAVVALLMALAVMSATSGCAILSEACQKALPVLSQANAYSTDAQVALDQAKEVLDQAKGRIPDADLYKAQAKLDAARVALQSASGALVAASGACTAPDVRTVFKEFVAVWEALRPLLMLASSTLGGAAGPVSDPAIWLDSKGAAAP